MVINNEATWPQNTTKCYFDLSEGYWGYILDYDGTCLSPFNDDWVNATDAIGATQMAALDYYVTQPEPINDDNYGWYDALEFDEYPLEIQCSSCFLLVIFESKCSFVCKLSC